MTGKKTGKCLLIAWMIKLTRLTGMDNQGHFWKWSKFKYRKNTQVLNVAVWSAGGGEIKFWVSSNITNDNNSQPWCR